MTDILPFDYGDHEIRVVVIDGDPWWVARDVCRVLGYQKISGTVQKHVRPGQTRQYRIGTPSGTQEATILNEGGLYRLIMRSDKPDAEQFQDWVTDEVLPQIRKTGSYSSAPALPKTFAEALELAAKQAREIERQEQEIAELEPQAAQFKKWQFSEDTVYVGARAKVIGLTKREAFEALRAEGVLRKRGVLKRPVNTPNRAYEQYFELIVRRVSGRKPWDVTPMITPEGQVVLAELLDENGWIN